eukprot:4939423-Pleurochrysis_carterae.AAC.2
MPGICAQPCTQSLAFSVPLRLRLYTQMSRTSDRPGGTELRSISSQLPLSTWLAISALSAAVQPARSSRRACLRVEASRTQPVLHAEPKGREALRTERRAAGFRLRSGYAPSPRWKCSRSSGSSDTSVLVLSELAFCGKEVSLTWEGCPSRFACWRLEVARVSEWDVDGSRRLGGVGCTELSVIRPATAFAIIKFRSGGYAACEAESHPCWSREPPTREAWVRCVQVREARPAKAGCKPGVQSSVVYFWACAPSAQSGNVICAQES